MIISRRKYEQDLKEAYEKGCRETQEQCWRGDRERQLFERMDKLETLVRKHLEPTEGCCGTNEKCAAPIPHY